MCKFLRLLEKNIVIMKTKCKLIPKSKLVDNEIDSVKREKLHDGRVNFAILLQCQQYCNLKVFSSSFYSYICDVTNILLFNACNKKNKFRNCLAQFCN